MLALAWPENEAFEWMLRKSTVILRATATELDEKAGIVSGSAWKWLWLATMWWKGSLEVVASTAFQLVRDSAQDADSRGAKQLVSL